ncbi:hypothetical protein, partial [Candidatus Symbiothrix dinenymphae]|uniref:hypothetical protein n=1 Tax=Candidatus Symbiothrix dinenymphae TaxID=467085 RepID=UPI000AB74D14
PLHGQKHKIMTELILKNRISRPKMDALLTFLVTWGIDAEVKHNIRKPTAREKHIAEFKEAIRETEAMAKHIRQNGTKGYQTMDEFLKTL